MKREIPKNANLTCLNINCPERFSLCCHATCRIASEPEEMLGVPHFFCSNCGKKWQGGECNANIPQYTKKEMQDFLTPSHEDKKKI